MQLRFQVKSGVALLQPVTVPQQEVPILEHPHVAQAVVDRPQGLGGNGSGGQVERNGTNLALVAFFAFTCVAVHEAGHVKGEKQPVIVEEIEGDQAVPLAQVDGAGGGESKRFDWNPEEWSRRRLVWMPIRSTVLFAAGRLAHWKGGAALRVHGRGRGQYEGKCHDDQPQVNAIQQGSQAFPHRRLFSPMERGCAQRYCFPMRVRQ
jgi:hypothetical protein